MYKKLVSKRFRNDKNVSFIHLFSKTMANKSDIEI